MKALEIGRQAMSRFEYQRDLYDDSKLCPECLKPIREGEPTQLGLLAEVDEEHGACLRRRQDRQRRREPASTGVV